MRQPYDAMGERRSGATLMNDEEYTLWGSPHSYYTGKIRSDLIKKGVPYREQFAFHPDFQARILPAIRMLVVPVLETPDGRIVQDTTDMIEELESASPTPSSGQSLEDCSPWNNVDAKPTDVSTRYLYLWRLPQPPEPYRPCSVPMFCTCTRTNIEPEGTKSEGKGTYIGYPPITFLSLQI